MTEERPGPAKGASGLLESVAAIAARETTASAVAAEALSRIAGGAALEAWTAVDPALAARRASELDAAVADGRPLGRLHGAPIGLKDIVDTADLPTENGSPIDRGRQPQRDATIVRRLRAAGAVAIGKTVTTEFAFRHPGPTRNPHDPARTPGGSSSGSAAAVAAGMVPAAIGTQTGGSVIRPAAYCGVVGYKPSFGRIPRTGVLQTCRSLDTIGVFARSVADAAAVAEALFGADGRDAYALEAGGGLLDVVSDAPTTPPRLAFFKGPAWSRAEPGTEAAFEALMERIAAAVGARPTTEPTPAPFDDVLTLHHTVMAAEIAHAIGPYLDRAATDVSAPMAEIIEEGRRVGVVDYLTAVDGRQAMTDALSPLFDAYDALITPSAPGEAPSGLEFTGDPAFCSAWTYCGAPAVSLPLATGPSGMPLGVQLVSRPGDDARLLRTAAWLSARLVG